MPVAFRTSPKSVIVDGVNQVEVAVVDGAALPLNTRALLIAGRDASGAARFLDPTAFAHPTASTVTPVAQAVITTVLLNVNTARKGALIYNNGTAILFLKLGSGASAVDFSAKVFPGNAYELAFPAYTGLVTGVWAGPGGGTAQVSELS